MQRPSPLASSARGAEWSLNYHLLTETDHPPPADYYASFTELAALGVCGVEFGRRIAACTGPRNRIVHEYDEVDPRRVHEAIGMALQDVSTYLREIEEYVKRASGG